MRYLSGLYALNVVSDDTDGDWHCNCLDWQKPQWLNTEDSPLSDSGIAPKFVPKLGHKVLCANHARACLDLLKMDHTALIQGMREHFINNEEYTPYILDGAIKIYKNSSNKALIERFMGKEYGMDWLCAKKKHNLQQETK